METAEILKLIHDIDHKIININSLTEEQKSEVFKFCGEYLDKPEKSVDELLYEKEIEIEEKLSSVTCERKDNGDECLCHHCINN